LSDKIIVSETSSNGESWQEVAREEDKKELNDRCFTTTFTIASNRECRFIRLGDVGMNHFGDDQPWISAWEIFGSLFG
jgi:hypothetical protein